MSSPPPGVEQALRQTPQFRGIRRMHWSPLTGGLSNSSFRLQADAGNYVVRMPSARAAARPAHRLEQEWLILEAASAAGVAPEPVWQDAHSGLLVSRFVQGPVWTARQVCDEASWPALLRMLRRVHAIELTVAPLDPVAAATRYWRRYTASAKPSAMARAAWRAFCAEADEMASAFRAVRLCHNDLIHGNLVGNPPVLIDWEYAALSDPLFDLATLIAYHDLPAARGAALLARYAGHRDPGEERRLTVLCRLCRYVSWLWFLERLGREAEKTEWCVTLPP